MAIRDLPTREERNAALALAPEHLQELIKSHVKNYFEWRAHQRRIAARMDGV